MVTKVWKTFLASALVKSNLISLVFKHLVFHIQNTHNSTMLRRCMLRGVCGQFGECLMTSGQTFQENLAPSYKSYKEGQIYRFRRSMLYHILFLCISFLLLLVLLLCYDHCIVVCITRKITELKYSCVL